MKSAPLRALLPPLLALVLIAVGCSDSLGQLCPTGSTQSGIFTTTLTFNANDSSQCYYAATDGGPLDASLAVTSPDAGPDSFSAAICSGLNADGGAPLFYFALPADVRAAPLTGGVFTYQATTPSLVSGTACGCNITVDETISFSVQGLSDASVVSIDVDGGLPQLAGFTGTVVDQITDGDDAGTNCSCNVPCDLQYGISGVLLQ